MCSATSKSCSTYLISKKHQIEPKSGLDSHLPPLAFPFLIPCLFVFISLSL